jgi:hypothetical protein
MKLSILFHDVQNEAKVEDLFNTYKRLVTNWPAQIEAFAEYLRVYLHAHHREGKPNGMHVSVGDGAIFIFNYKGGLAFEIFDMGEDGPRAE